MAFQPAPGVAQFNIRGNLQGEIVENVLHYIRAGAPTWSGSELSLFASQIGQQWVDLVLPWLSNEYQLLEVEGRDLSEEGGSQGFWTPPTIEIGGQVSPPLPNNVSFCLTKRTARSGRSYRGRFYVAGLTEGQVTGNSVLDPTAIAIRNALRAIIIRAPGDLGGGVVLSRQNQKVVRPQGFPVLITDVDFIDQTIDSQRRRLPGR